VHVTLAGQLRLFVAHLALAEALAGSLGGCGEPSQPVAFATPRPEDPELAHSWQIPMEKTPLAGGDLGSTPPALADALMEKSAAPGLAMRSADACATKGVLGSTPSVALRLTIAEGGAVTAVEGDPAGPAATCLADAAKAELAKLDPLPAGAALLLLRFRAANPPQGHP
jgi:hypothetical protein